MAKDPSDLLDNTIQARILVMRHPETLGNVNNLYQGQSDSGLSVKGEAQCSQAVAAMIAWQPDQVVTSPIGRCMRVSEAVGRFLSIDVERDNRLKELSFGALEGLSDEEAQQRGLSYKWDVAPDEPAAPGAETLTQFVTRVTRAADDIQNKKGRIAVVTHGGVIRVLFSHWLRMEQGLYWPLEVQNVDSACFYVSTEETVFLERFGIKPEWLFSLNNTDRG